MKKLWSELSRRLGWADEASAQPETTAAHAAAALLLEMTEADLEVTPEERQAVRRALAATFGLKGSEIDRLIREADAHLDRQVSFYPHVQTINALCEPDEKALIVEQMWRVAMADGDLDKYEEHYLRKLCQLLHVPHQTFIQARHKVEAEQR